MIRIRTKYVPPSVNGCWFNAPGKGRVKTERYRQWIAAAGWDFNGKGTISGAFTATITIDRAHRNHLADIDNRCKPVLDLLQAHGIIENDSYCEAVTIQWGECGGGIEVDVLPFVLDAVAAA